MSVLRDSNGTKLLDYGLQSSEAKWGVFVCLDKHKILGQKLHVFSIQRVRWLIERARKRGIQPVYGSSHEIEVKNTGAGFLFSLEQLNAVSHPLPRGGARFGTISEQSVRLVREFYERHGYRTWHSTLKQQLKQIDLIIFRPGESADALEIKCRGTSKEYDQLFIQTHETNPGGAHS